MLTSDAEWDPHSEQFMINERAFNASKPSTIAHTLLPLTTINEGARSTFKISLAAVSATLSESEMAVAVEDTVHITYQWACQLASQSTSERSSSVTKEQVVEIWGISLNAAAQTLCVTTQKGIKNVVHPVVQCYATKQSRLRYNQLGSRHGHFYSDTFFSLCSSMHGNTMAQLYVNDIKYLGIMPIKKKSVWD